MITRRIFIKIMTALGLQFMLPKQIKAAPADAADFQMIILTDSQCVDYNVFKRTADAAVKNFPDAQLATIIGDLVDNGEAAYQWRAWDSAAKNLLKNRIFLPVMGNHECYDHDWLNYVPRDYLKHFDFPDNGTEYRGYFYTYDYGAVHFMILNTQFYELEDLVKGLFEAQDKWLRSDKTKLPWKIVLMHKDVYNYGADDFSDEGKRLMNTLEKLDVDLVLTGHLHTYRRRKFEWYKPIYVLCGVSGDQHYTEPERSVDIVSASPEDNYIIMEASANELRLRCFDVSGKLIDDFNLKK